MTSGVDDLKGSRGPEGSEFWLSENLGTSGKQ